MMMVDVLVNHRVIGQVYLQNIGFLDAGCDLSRYYVEFKEPGYHKTWTRKITHKRSDGFPALLIRVFEWVQTVQNRRKPIAP